MGSRLYETPNIDRLAADGTVFTDGYAACQVSSPSRASIMTGLVISSAFSAIVVYATDLMPDKVGMVAGIFFGLMFGLGGIGSAFFGWIADMKGVEYIFRLSSWLPLLGIIAVFLPDIRAGRRV